MADISWIMRDDIPVPIGASYPLENPVTEPLPLPLWRVDPARNNGYPFTGLMPVPKPGGAFRNAEKLERVYIPETVRKIGAEAFRYTALKTVKISAECQYSTTSFPEDCEVEFYGGGGDFGQLYDRDGYAVLDCDAARIFIKE